MQGLVVAVQELLGEQDAQQLAAQREGEVSARQAGSNSYGVKNRARQMLTYREEEDMNELHKQKKEEEEQALLERAELLADALVNGLPSALGRDPNSLAYNAR